jgi:hypothetical protein
MKIVFLAAAFLLPMATPAQAPERPARAQPADTPIVSPDRPSCTPIRQQVAGENRAYPGTRLDQQPPAQLLYAVDRQVGGCREVTFVRGRR